MKKNTKIIVLIILVVVFLVADQALKIYCMNTKKEETVELLPFLQLTYDESTKGAFGVGQNSVVTYVISTVVVLGIVLKFFFQQIERVNLGMIIGISLVFAGGFSNLIDKVIHGFVINCIQLWNLPIVNLSFILMILGWIDLAAVFAYQTWKGRKEEQLIKKKG